MESVHVSNLPPDIRIRDIEDFFRPFGRLVYIDINRRVNPLYACVQFDSARNALESVKSRHGYDYEGYTLQVRLVENEVKERLDGTPPPSAMYSSYERLGNNDAGYNHNYAQSDDSFQSNHNSQWFINNCSGMEYDQHIPTYQATNYNKLPMQNMTDNLSNNKNNIPQLMPHSFNSWPNVYQQCSNENTANIQRHNNSNALNVQDQYSNTNRSDIPQDRNYLNTDHSDILQQNMGKMDYFNNSSRNDCNNAISKYGTAQTNNNYNGNKDTCKPGFVDNYTRGLSGSGRKWFLRYIMKGFSPKTARAKALEHRTVPYLRGDASYKPISTETTTLDLEKIGNTINSLLSPDPANNYKNDNWRSKKLLREHSNVNYEIPAPSSSNASDRRDLQTPRNAVSKTQYLKSLGILKLMSDGVFRSSDETSKKYHKQIVDDYEQFEIRQNALQSYNELSLKLKKKKTELLIAAQHLGSESLTRCGGAHRKRMKILMNEDGFSEDEAKALAIHHQKDLESLRSIKRAYNQLTRQIDFPPSDTISSKTMIYRDDIRYFYTYDKKSLSSLSESIKSALRACLIRIHNYQKEHNLPLTESEFTKSLLNTVAKKYTETRDRYKDLEHV